MRIRSTRGTYSSRSPPTCCSRSRRRRCPTNCPGEQIACGTATPLTPVAGHQGIGRRIWTRGEGRFTAHYRATIEVLREATDLATVATVPLAALPGRAIHYLWPSRYCQPDRLKEFAIEQFGGLDGGARVVAMADWTRANLTYAAGSDEQTNAADTFEQKQGVCRDFRPCRISSPAPRHAGRMVSAYAWQLARPIPRRVEAIRRGCIGDPDRVAPTRGGPHRGRPRRNATDQLHDHIRKRDYQRQSVRVERIAEAARPPAPHSCRKSFRRRNC